MILVIVESPAKAKTIERYLGGDHQVLASFGHLRDLVAKDGAVLPDEDFAMKWQVSPDRTKHLSAITKAVQKTDKLILATDPDREGEAIAWHLLEALKARKVLKDLPVERVIFNAITKNSVLEAMANPRQLDEDLVHAYLARRALDYLVGFTLSPVLWRKLPGVKSAGRVQSTALRLICERETERESFKPQDFWTIDVHLLTAKEKEKFSARLITLNEDKLGKFTLTNPEEAEAARALAEKANWCISAIESKPTSRHAAPPFTTSTLQQEASRKLGFGADRTMRAAQKLYDGSLGAGFITYMRTDSVNITPSAIHQMRKQIQMQFGADYLPEKPNYYRAKAKNAQEAHEAIRPTDFSATPEQARLSGDEGRLYEMIWKRAIASQMAMAKFQQTQMLLEGDDGQLGARATGRVVIFDGFLKVYFEGRDLPENDKGGEEKEQQLPQGDKGQALKTDKAKTEQHTTQPKPRFTEASLVKRMEELGIGRPSTYAPTMRVLRERNYVVMEKKQFVPESRGRIVVEFLKKYFGKYIDYNFTAALEEQLDEVSAGKEEWRRVLRDFWTGFIQTIDAVSELRITHVIDHLNEELASSVFASEGGGTCPQCEKSEMSIRLGKFGAFVGCGNYPECDYTRPLTADKDEGGATELGECPETGQAISVKTGRFGPYVERAKGKGETKPKRTSLPKKMARADVDLEFALQLLTLPRLLGTHPEDGEEITAGLGRYGAFVKHGAAYANLDKAAEVVAIDLERAVALLAEKKANPSKGRRGAGGTKARGPKGKVLGEHPDGGEIQLLKGRFGPYVKCEKTNASLGPVVEDELTLTRAIKLINDRRAKGPAKPKRKKVAKK